MAGNQDVAVVIADVVVIFLAIAAMAAIAGLMWLVGLVVMATTRRLRPQRRDRYTEIQVKPRRPGSS